MKLLDKILVISALHVRMLIWLVTGRCLVCLRKGEHAVDCNLPYDAKELV